MANDLENIKVGDRVMAVNYGGWGGPTLDTDTFVTKVTDKRVCCVDGSQWNRRNGHRWGQSSSYRGASLCLYNQSQIDQWRDEQDRKRARETIRRDFGVDTQGMSDEVIAPLYRDYIALRDRVQEAAKPRAEVPA